MTRSMPICWGCWDLRQLGRTPALRSDALAHCCFCGSPTRDGLRTLADPALVTYPQEVVS
jgi:hypothetical protein